MSDPFKYFRVEAREILASLSQGVLTLERSGADTATIATMLRQAHTLKGAARLVKRPEIAAIAHAMEDDLAPLRDRPGPLPAQLVESLLARVDALGSQLVALDEPPAEAPHPESAAVPATLATPKAPEEFETSRVDLAELDSLLDGLAAVDARTELLDDAMTLAKEARARAARLAELLSASPGVAESDRRLAEELRGSLTSLRSSLETGLVALRSDLGTVRTQANALRLIRTEVIFGQLEWATRDAARQVGRRVEFSAEGGENELDGEVLRTVRDALLHVVRNAVDHGIEPEAERRAAGKSAIGHVAIKVEREGGRARITCSDDGRGIDREAVRAAALKAGHAIANDDVELSELVFLAGVSTRASVSDLSGRGVGLDVVKDAAARLQGSLALSSEPGRGTVVSLVVPVSLSSMQALVAEAGGIAVCVPLDVVRRTIRLEAKSLVAVGDREVLVEDDAALPFLRLRALLAGDAEGREGGTAIVIESAGRQAAIGVDRLLGTRQIVVRPLPARLSGLPLLGASFDARGDPQLVLEARGFVELASSTKSAPTPRVVKARLPLLVIDDSLTTRMLEQSILEAAGYEVDLASSAEEALAKARERRYALFIVDVEMPGMSGIQFVARTRETPDLREIPSIVVSSLSSLEDRRKAAEAGARGYIAKGEFAQNELLGLIRGLAG